jgi:hypothetical protein
MSRRFIPVVYAQVAYVPFGTAETLKLPSLAVAVSALKTWNGAPIIEGRTRTEIFALATGLPLLVVTDPWIWPVGDGLCANEADTLNAIPIDRMQMSSGFIASPPAAPVC